MLSMRRLFAASVLLLLATTISRSQAQEIARTITVSGEGSVSAPPDIATINIGVDTTADSPQAALTANSQQFEQVLAALTAQGVNSTDVQTTFFNLAPQRQFGPNGEDLGITGFQVTNQVQVDVRDLDALGTILDALVAAGSNRISGVSFGIDDDTELRNRARALAVADATARAAVLAQAAGARVGNLIAIREQSVPQGPVFNTLAFAAGTGGSVPVATGELDIQEIVFLQFALVGA